MDCLLINPLSTNLGRLLLQAGAADYDANESILDTDSNGYESITGERRVFQIVDCPIAINDIISVK